MEKDTIYLVPQFISCPHCGARITIEEVGKYFGVIKNVDLDGPNWDEKTVDLNHIKEDMKKLIE